MAQPLKIMMIIAIALIQCVMRTASVWITVLLPDIAADACGIAMKSPSPSVAPLSAWGLRIHYQIPAPLAILRDAAHVGQFKREMPTA